MDKKTKSVKNTKATKSDRTDLIIGVIAVLAVMALFVWLIASLATDGKAVGSISYEGTAVRGKCTTINCQVDSYKLKEGQNVTWFVDGKKVATTPYSSTEGIKLDYTPTHTGKTRVVAKCGGRYCGIRDIDVQPPQLTFEAQNLTITYGDKLPELNYKCAGFVGDDCLDDTCYDGKCCVGKNCKLEVGTYPITFDKECSYKDYCVDYKQGTLTVVPKKLTIEGLTKVYDGKAEIDLPNCKLTGVIDGDEVMLCQGKLQLDNKDVGNGKKVNLSNTILCGKDAHNYTLDSTVNATVLPKLVHLKGLTVQDKQFDGTTKATIKQIGNLTGITPGDNVAIGSIDIQFEQAKAGKQKVVVKQITLVGLDKNNYQIVLPTNLWANITNASKQQYTKLVLYNWCIQHYFSLYQLMLVLF